MKKISWKKYILKKQTEPPNKLLKQALSYIVEKNTALDIGAGSLVDTQLLLHEGFKSVEAFDTDNTSVEIAKTILNKRLIFSNINVTKVNFNKNYYDIINAQYFLPYLSKKETELFIPHLYKSLKPEGVFTGQFFGEKDSWNIEGDYRAYYSEEDTKKCSHLWVLNFYFLNLRKVRVLVVLEYLNIIKFFTLLCKRYDDSY